MTDTGLIAYYLSIKVKQKEEYIFIFQESYAKDTLKRFKMDNFKPISMPIECVVKLSNDDEAEKVDLTLFKSIVESLQYLMLQDLMLSMQPDLWVVIWKLQQLLISNPPREYFDTSKVQSTATCSI